MGLQTKDALSSVMWFVTAEILRFTPCDVNFETVLKNERKFYLC